MSPTSRRLTSNNWNCRKSVFTRGPEASPKNRSSVRFSKVDNSFQRWRTQRAEEHINDEVEEQDDEEQRISEEALAARRKSEAQWQLVNLAREVAMTMRDVLEVKQVFDSYDLDKSGELDVSEFENVVHTLLQAQLRDNVSEEELARQIKSLSWSQVDTDKTGQVSFEEFLRWYSSNGFKEDLLLSEEEQRIRTVAREYGVSLSFVDSVKRHFDAADTDHSGSVSISEFEEVLHKSLKIPVQMRLPRSRIQYFWSEIDTDCSGEVGFDEFLVWWLKYFGNDARRGEEVIREFYKSFRRLDSVCLDPHPYAPKTSSSSTE